MFAHQPFVARRRRTVYRITHEGAIASDEPVRNDVACDVVPAVGRRPKSLDRIEIARDVIPASCAGMRACELHSGAGRSEISSLSGASEGSMPSEGAHGDEFLAVRRASCRSEEPAPFRSVRSLRRTRHACSLRSVRSLRRARHACSPRSVRSLRRTRHACSPRSVRSLRRTRHACSLRSVRSLRRARHACSLRSVRSLRRTRHACSPRSVRSLRRARLEGLARLSHQALRGSSLTLLAPQGARGSTSRAEVAPQGAWGSTSRAEVAPQGARGSTPRAEAAPHERRWHPTSGGGTPRAEAAPHERRRHPTSGGGTSPAEMAPHTARMPRYSVRCRMSIGRPSAGVGPVP